MIFLIRNLLLCTGDDSAAAIAALEKALAAGAPDVMSCYFVIGFAHAKLENYREGVAAMTKGLAAAPAPAPAASGGGEGGEQEEEGPYVHSNLPVLVTTLRRRSLTACLRLQVVPGAEPGDVGKDA